VRFITTMRPIRTVSLAFHHLDGTSGPAPNPTSLETLILPQYSRSYSATP